MRNLRCGLWYDVDVAKVGWRIAWREARITKGHCRDRDFGDICSFYSLACDCYDKRLGLTGEPLSRLSLLRVMRLFKETANATGRLVTEETRSAFFSMLSRRRNWL